MKHKANAKKAYKKYSQSDKGKAPIKETKKK